MTITPCLTNEQFEGLAVGKLAPYEADDLLWHVSECEDCGSKWDELSRNDELAVLLKEGEPLGGLDQEEQECRSVIGQLSQLTLNEPSDSSITRLNLREYQLIERIGQGGMGVVYRAIHTVLGKTVAVKVLAHVDEISPSLSDRFEREIQALGKLDHPNIVTATDAGTVDGTQFLVMEYVDGHDLASLSKKIGPLPIDVTCKIILQAATGLQYAHEHGLVHRDIKPSNLMLAAPQMDSSNPEAQLKVLDLGLVRESNRTDDTVTRDGQIIGSVDYVAPEQISGAADVDARADIYSLGCTFYFLLTGRPPFRDGRFKTNFQIMNAQQWHDPQPVQKVRSDVPKAVAKIVQTMLMKRPDRRFSSMQQVVDQLSSRFFKVDLSNIFSELDQRSDTPESALKPEVKTRKPPTKMKRWLGWTAGIALLVAYTTIAIQMDTKQGTLHVEFSETDFNSKIIGQKVVLERTDGKVKKPITIQARQTSFKTTPGTYRLVVTLDSGIEIVGNDELVINHGAVSSIKAKYVSDDFHLRIAKRILELGGRIELKMLSDNSQHQVIDSRQLPASPFQVIDVQLHDADRFTDSDAKLLGRVSTLHKLALDRGKLSKAAMASIGKLKNLESIQFLGTQISPSGMKHLRELKSISSANIGNFNIGKVDLTADGLTAFASLPKLEQLILPDTVKAKDFAYLAGHKNPLRLEIQTKLTDDELRHLSTLDLKALYLYSENFQGDGIRHLTKMESFRELRLWGPTKLSDDMIDHLKRMPNLRILELQSAILSNRLVERFGELTQLHLLQLTRSNMNDQMLEHISGMKHLKSLTLGATQVSQEGGRKIRAALPGCVVHL